MTAKFGRFIAGGVLAAVLACAALIAGRGWMAVHGQSIGLKPETVASGLEYPWAVAFLPDGSYLVTEKAGRLRRVLKDGTVSPPIQGVPSVETTEQAGLLDVAVSPDFGRDKRIYFTFTEPRDGSNGTSVASARLSSDLRRLEDYRVIFRQLPAINSAGHFGSRIVFRPDGTLFVVLGDRQIVRDKAQDLSTHLGKIVRITPEGTAPADNPFIGKEGIKPEIWSYGHRNIQGAALNPQTGELWTAEHGAKGGDEINIPRAGKNYGWPVITYGVDYNGSKIGEGTSKPGMEQPIRYWDPSVAPSGFTFVTSDRYPAWKGSALMGTLASKELIRLMIDGDQITGEERMFKGQFGRIRDVRQGPDGFIYILTDERNGRLIRLAPT
ncbi:PQQ-dependent sugar dehydrogenase [Alsobacter sp. R-9]